RGRHLAPIAPCLVDELSFAVSLRHACLPLVPTNEEARGDPVLDLARAAWRRSPRLSQVTSREEWDRSIALVSCRHRRRQPRTFELLRVTAFEHANPVRSLAHHLHHEPGTVEGAADKLRLHLLGHVFSLRHRRSPFLLAEIAAPSLRHRRLDLVHLSRWSFRLFLFCSGGAQPRFRLLGPGPWSKSPYGPGTRAQFRLEPLVGFRACR